MFEAGGGERESTREALPKGSTELLSANLAEYSALPIPAMPSKTGTDTRFPRSWIG